MIWAPTCTTLTRLITEVEFTLRIKKPFVLGLVGGVASGKSHVARTLERLGAVSIDADQLGHQVLLRPLIVRRLRQLFGPHIIDAAGVVKRKELGELVFGDSAAAGEARRELEAIVHPLIHAAAVHQLRGLQEAEDPPELVVIDAPLLLEAGWAPLCDAILFIDSPTEVRLRRARERGWSEQDFNHREAAQMPLERKRKEATHIIVGEAEPQEQERQLRRLIEEIKATSSVRGRGGKGGR